MSSVTGSIPRLRRNRPAPQDGSPRNGLRIAVVFGLLALVVWGLLSVSVVPLALEIREGEVNQTNIRSPRKLTYTSQVRTKAERERAASAVQEVVEIDPARVQRQRAGLNSLLQDIAAARNSPGSTPDQRKSQLARLGQPALEEPSITWLAALDDSRWYMVSSEAQRLLWDALKDKLPEWRVPEVVRELPLRSSDQLTENERSLAVDLASRFVAGNLVPNRETTARLRKEAEEAVAPVQVTVEKGETVLREGQVVSAADLEKLDLLGLRNPTTDWRQVGAAAAFAILTMSMLAAYIAAFQPNLATRDRGLGLIALLVIVTVLTAKVVLPTRPLLIYAFPLPAVAMLIATLIDGRLAIVVGALLGVLVGFVAGSSLEAATLALVTGVVAAGAVWRRERLQAYFVAGLMVALAQMAVVVAFQLAQRGEDLQQLLMIAAFCVVNGLVSAMLAVGATYVLGRMFGITTTMQLLELANPTQPLLRRLLMEAPGTYHHSIMVGNLGERAAEEVGADPLLVRVGAYYHDIGKLKRPYFFVENQAGGENVHETLEPEVSADIVRAHVRDGVELCEQYGVPPTVRALIPAASRNPAGELLLRSSGGRVPRGRPVRARSSPIPLSRSTAPEQGGCDPDAGRLGRGGGPGQPRSLSRGDHGAGGEARDGPRRRGAARRLRLDTPGRSAHQGCLQGDPRRHVPSADRVSRAFAGPDRCVGHRRRVCRRRGRRSLGRALP